MSRPSTPHIKHAEVRRKPLIPGPNSWAQEAEKASVMKGNIPGTATNRSKYEDKPMPPLPQNLDMSPPPPGPGKPGYIQPATPLAYSSPTSNKNRAVTDPVASKKALEDGKVSIADLRNKFAGSRTHTGTNVDTSITWSDSQVLTPDTPEMGNGQHGGRNINQIRRQTPPASAPANANLPDPYQSPEAIGRQTNSTPVPTRRYLRENKLPTPILTQASFSVPQLTYSDAYQVAQENKKLDGIIVGDGRLNPTRSGTYGTVGEVELVEGKAIHRVASHVVMIENAEPLPSASEQQQQTRPASPSPSAVSSIKDHTILPSIAYSPSVYGGVWEKDPHVGYTLPPFSPLPPHFHEDGEPRGDRPQDPHQTVPAHSGGPYGPPSRFRDYAPSSHSTNSWANDHSNTPFHAAVPPLFSNGPANNSVPPPPHNYRDYQPPLRPVPPELQILELNIHHHIDTCFGSLSRHLTDKIDQCSDQLLREYEDAEQRFEKSLKNLKTDMKDIQDKIQVLQHDIDRSHGYCERAETSIKDLKSDVSKVSSKLEKIDEELGEVGTTMVSLSTKSGNHEKTAQSMEHKLREVAGKLDRLAEYPATEYQPTGSSPRRSQSTSQPSPAFYQQRQQFHSGASNGSVGPRSSNASSRGQRSNNATGGAAAGPGDGRSSRREYYAEMGNNTGDAPDLRQHPAFLASQQTHPFDSDGHPLGVAPDGSFYQLPSFAAGGPNGWYQQAYGS